MRLFIAEKPELAKAIVEGLGGGRRKEGYYACGNDYVTWCFGHMLQLLDPEDYDERYATWRMDDLPIAHLPWRKKPASGKSGQLRISTQLLKQADSVVHAGDPDDEGQLLVDEILAYAHCSLPVKRLLINDNNTKVVRSHLPNLRQGADSQAGKEEGHLLVGMQWFSRLQTDLSRCQRQARLQQIPGATTNQQHIVMKRSHPFFCPMRKASERKPDLLVIPEAPLL